MASVGCCCSTDPCAIASDDFSVDNLAGGYDQRSGTWAVGAGVLSTTSGTALVVSNTASPVGLTSIYCQVVVRLPDTTAIARLIVAYVDDSNYWFAEAKAGATNGTLKLFQRSGGVNTQRGTTQNVSSFQINEDWTVTLCYNGVTMLAFIGIGTGVTAEVGFTSAVTVASTKAGVGVVSGIGGSVTFDSFLLERQREDSPTCKACGTCACCTTSMPDQMQVEFNGFTNFTCTDCVAFNGVYILDKVSSCTLSYTGATLCGGAATISVSTDSVTTPGFCRLQVRVVAGLRSITFATATEATVDCLNLVNKVASTIGNSGTPCNVAFACTLTSL